MLIHKVSYQPSWAGLQEGSFGPESLAPVDGDGVRVWREGKCSSSIRAKRRELSWPGVGRAELFGSCWAPLACGPRTAHGRRAQPTGPSWLAASAAALLLTEGAVSTRLFLTSCSGLRDKLQGFCKRRSISKPNWTKAQREKRPDFILLSSFYFYFPGIGNGLRRAQQQNGANWYFHCKQGQGSIPGLQLSSYVPQTNLFFFFFFFWCLDLLIWKVRIIIPSS